MVQRRLAVDPVEAVLAAAAFVGLDAAADMGTDHSVDVLMSAPGGSTVAVEVKSAALVSGDSAPGQLERWSVRRDADVMPIMVADRITSDAREYLNREGWSWLDLRGHVRLTGPGIFVDADVPAAFIPGPRRSGFTGQVSIELATLLLLDPDRPIGVRGAASLLSRAASSVSEALGALRAAGLVDRKNRPAVPELFGELAGQWKPITRDVARLPGGGRERDDAALRLGLDHIPETTGWALTDTVAAVVYGAPVATRADHPPDFYVPDQAIARRATQVLGLATSPQVRAARLRIAPVAAVCSQRVDVTAWADEEWPLAHPLFVALDLAQDPGRGREILDGWTPRRPWRRVW